MSQRQRPLSAVSAILAGDAVGAPVSGWLCCADRFRERARGMSVLGARRSVSSAFFKGSMSAEGVFSALLSCDSALGPAVGSLLRSEDPQFFFGSMLPPLRR